MKHELKEKEIMVLCFSSKIEIHETEKGIKQFFELQKYCLNRFLLKAKCLQTIA